MTTNRFKTNLYLPAQAAAETEATITRWLVAAGQSFTKGQVLAEIESAKTSFTFEAPCDGSVVAVLCAQNQTTTYDKPVVQIETGDQSMKQSIPVAGVSVEAVAPHMEVLDISTQKPIVTDAISLMEIGGYLPKRVVPNSELLAEFPDITEDYIFGVTGIRERRWAGENELPSDLAYQASLQAITKSGLTVADIDAIIVATDTPDAAMPATACILQQKLGCRGGVPAFDLNAACSGWLYGICVAQGLVCAGTAKNILVVGVDMQSRLLDKKDKDVYFLFGDGAGATVVSRCNSGHRIKQHIMLADAKGISMASRDTPGYRQIMASDDPWVRLDGKALFKFATQSFAQIISDVAIKSGWKLEDVRWVVPHQANARIIKAAAARCGIPFERFYLNIDHVGNTSSASIPLALVEIEKGLQKGDKIIFCSVGAGVTAAAISVEW